MSAALQSASAVIGWSVALLDAADVQRAVLPAGCTLRQALDRTDLDTGFPLVVQMRTGRDAEPFYYARAEWDGTIVPEGAVIAALTMPQGKQTSRVVALLALVVAAAILAPPVAGALGLEGALGVTAVQAAQIAFAGIQLVGTALINWLLPPPTPRRPGKQEDVSPTYTLTAQGNYARLGQAIPEHFGTHLHYLDLVSAYSEFVGGHQLLFLGFCLGEGRYEIHEMGFDRTPVWRGEQWNLIGRADWSDTMVDAVFEDATVPWGFSDWQITMTGTGIDAITMTPSRAWASGEDHTLSFIALTEDSDDPITLHADLYPDTLPEQTFTVTAAPQLFTWTFNSSHADMADAEFRLFVEDLAADARVIIKDIQIAQRGYAPPFMERKANYVAGLTDSYIGVAFEQVEPGAEPSLFNDAVTTAGEVSGQELKATNEDGYGPVGPFPLNAAGTVAIGGAVDFVWQNGLFTQNVETGGYEDATTSVTVQVRAIDDVGLALGSWTTVIEETFTDRSGPRLKRHTVRFTLASPGRYEVQAFATHSSPDDNTVIDVMSWGGLRAYFAPTEAIGSESWLMLRAAAGQNLQGSAASKFYVIATRRLPVLDEDGTWSEDLRPTRCIGAAIGEVHRKTWPESTLDTEGLASLCATWAVRGDTFDGLFDTARSAWDALQSIARTGRSRPLLPGGTVTILRDEPREIRTVSLMPSNVIPGSVSPEYIVANDDLADALICEYTDNRTWRPATVECVLPATTPVNKKRIQVPFITNRAQVWREGMFQLGQNAYRRILIECETEMEGLMLWPGHKVLFGHDAVNWGEPALVQAFDFDGATKRVILDRAMNWKDGETHRLSLSKKTGRVWGPVEVTQESATTCILPDPLPAGLSLPDAGEFTTKATSDGRREVARALFGYGTVFAKDMIVGRSVPRAPGSNGMPRARVSLAIDDPRLYTADAGMPPAQPAPPDPPAAEDLDFTLDVTVTGSGDTRDVEIEVTGYSADMRMLEYEIGGIPYGTAPSAHFTVTVPADEADSLRIRAWGRWGAGAWQTWSA